MTSEINQVTKRVYISSSKAAKDKHALKSRGITHVINTTAEIPNYHPYDFSYIKLNLEDGNDDLISVLQPSYDFMINALMNPRSKILIHCHMGISRSSSVLIYYLMTHFNMSYDKAYRLAKSRRSIIRPNMWYQSQLKWLENRK